jgi:RHH-type rel operon transcriptional repressor/antitoxin RelB
MPAVNIPPELDSRLDKLAAKTGRSRDAHVQDAIIEHLSEIEDGFLALERLKANEEAIPLEEMRRRFVEELGD